MLDPDLLNVVETVDVCDAVCVVVSERDAVLVTVRLCVVLFDIVAVVVPLIVSVVEADNDAVDVFVADAVVVPEDVGLVVAVVTSQLKSSRAL